ncbi:GTP-binding protein, partial [Bacillus altitudinis]|uniref:GTP-binding protein n=1 Tax=Bacillus altitudinis TaxID=293387 RepID=UPI001F24DC6B
VDGVVLVVDGYEGCMGETGFVVKKGVEENLRGIVVVNKIEGEFGGGGEVVDEVIELLIELDGREEEFEFPVVYG